MSEWREFMLADVCRRVTDGDWIETKDQGGFDYRLLQVSNIGLGCFRETGKFRYVTGETFRRLRCTEISPGMVLVARMPDPVGRAWYVKELDHPAITAVDVAIVDPDPEQLDGRFAAYLLNSPTQLAEWAAAAGGTTRMRITRRQLADVRLSLPSLAVQKQISSVLGRFDDLIENNRRRVEVLEEIARTIYREWFVRFRYPGHENVPLVDSALGPIPEGWSIGSLGDLAALDRVNIQPRDSPGELFDHYSIPAFDDGARPVVEPGGAIKSGKYLLSTAAVLVSKLNPRIDRVWFAEPGTEQRSVTSTEFLILRPNERSHLEHLYLLARDPKFREQLTALSGGTSGSHQRAKPADFLKLPVAVAPAAVLDILAKATSDQLRLARQLARQGNKLAGLRDLLLPKLVTGQIDVSHLDLNALTEAATA